MRIVIKIGTSTLTHGSRQIDSVMLHRLCQQICALREQGHAVVVVSSGAVACGRQELNHPKLPSHLPGKQMLAAIGQGILMQHYRNSLNLLGQFCAQILLTRADLEDRARYLNARNTFAALEQQGVIAIVNENDSLATEEIRVGDNDQLAALVANLIQADLLILLTDQDGLFSANPNTDPNAQLICEISGPISESLWQSAGAQASAVAQTSAQAARSAVAPATAQVARSAVAQTTAQVAQAAISSSAASGSALGTGGMLTKLKAAEMARAFGCEVVIARGSRAAVLNDVVNRVDIPCSRFKLIDGNQKESRKRYLLAQRSLGKVLIDAGAQAALARGKSLLTVGVCDVQGEFALGDPIDLCSTEGQILARGLSQYPAAELVRIKGMSSAEISGALGYSRGDEAVHRDHLVWLG